MTDQGKKPPRDVGEYIDQNLKRVYAQLEKEDMPDRFKDLLAQLRALDDDPSTKT